MSSTPRTGTLSFIDNFGCFLAECRSLQLLILEVACFQVASHIYSSRADIAVGVALLASELQTGILAVPKCWELIQALLEKNPDHRASLWHLKEHEWILQEVDASQYQLYDVIPCSESELRPPTHYREGGGRMAGRAGQALSRSSGLAGDHHLLGDSQDPSLELSSLESNVISNVSSTGVDVGSHLGASNLMDEQL
jgi:serine/threonine protein kinase